VGDSDKLATNNPIDKLVWATPAQDITDTVNLDELLQGLRLLASDDDRKKNSQEKWDGETPASVQVIDSGALKITQELTKLAKNAGGLGALAVLASGGLATILKIFTNSNISNSIIVTLFGGAFLLLSATAIAVALLVGGDLLARGGASAARHQARGQVAAAFLGATASLHDTPKSQAPAPVPSPPASIPTPDPQAVAPASAEQPKALWVRPLPFRDPSPWRQVLGYDRVLAGDPPLEQTFYLVQIDPGQQPQWKSSSDVDGWIVSAADPNA
jgi:hypothetical protein